MKCKECGSDMVLRDSYKGKFYGCSKFPDCKHTENVEQLTVPLPVQATKVEVGTTISITKLDYGWLSRKGTTQRAFVNKDDIIEYLKVNLE